VTSGPIISLRDVRQDYVLRRGIRGKRSFPAVDGISLDLRKGEVLGIVGESGSGKTTLGRLMIGLNSPTTGQVLLDGMDIHAQPAKDIARRVQFVFQDPYSSLNPRRSIRQILEQPLRVHGIGDRAARAAATIEMMHAVGMAERYLSTYPDQLSGGQRQRIVIARALILKPHVIICDEPTSALDISVQAQILNLLMDLKDAFGLTYVIISHNLAVVEHIATRVAVMYAGRIVECDCNDRIFAAPRHPYTRMLLRSVMAIAPGTGIPQTMARSSPARSSTGVRGCAFAPRC
jgi:peptide/nickel transport system ATP-binding protein